jgi:hypothetical protein
MLVPDLMVVLTKDGLRMVSQVKVGDEVWTGKGWMSIKSISNNASARFYDYDFGNTTFRANAAARIWQPTGSKCPAQLYQLNAALGPDGDYAADAVAEWDGYFWAVGDWIDSLNKPCVKTLDAARADKLMPSAGVVKLRNLYVHRDTRIPRKSYEKRAVIPAAYMYAELPVLRAFLRGFVIAKATPDGTMELSSDRHACTMQLALNAIGIETDRRQSSKVLTFPNTAHVNRVMDTDFEEREEKAAGQLQAVAAKGELKCFSWDVDSCWMSGIVLQN